MEWLLRVVHVLPWADWLALGWFFVAWIGYIFFAKRHATTLGGSLMSTATVLRTAWMRQTTQRENRMVDAVAVNNLASSPSFFASTTIFIIGGLVAALGAGDKANELVNELPFIARTSALVLDLKLLVLTAVYVNAFFRFTWSMRQYSFGVLMVASVPERDYFPGHEDERERFAHAGSRMMSLAAETFNDGLRAIYMSFAAVLWLLSPAAFALGTAGVIWVLYRREFHSEILAVMREYGEPPR